MKREALAFARIPGVPPLFLDFLADFEKVADFYRGGRLLWPLSEGEVETLRERARQAAARALDREALCRILREQNARWRSSSATLAAIQELAEPETVAIVTGQQAGLFTGPLFTLYKAWTAIAVARRLRALGIRAVPIFWIHSEDHDLAEVTGCGLLGRGGEWVQIQYPTSADDEGKPASALVLEERIEGVRQMLLRALPDSEFLPEIAALLQEAYAPGVSLVEAFARTMARLHADVELILLDPSDDRIKRLMAPILSGAVRKWPHLSEALRAESERVRARGYRPQIHPERGSAFLFVLEAGRRRPLAWDGERFVLRGGEKAIGAEELLEEIARRPARFSPNVALRPLGQDAVLPTLAYVGGPSEIAYFAQLGPLYAAFDLPQPLLCPRLSLTLVEPRLAELLARYGLALTDLFAGIEVVQQRLLERTLDDVRRFEEAHRAVTEAVERLRPLLRDAEPTLERPLERTKEAMRRQIETLRQHYLQARARRDEVLSRQARRLVLALAPHGMLQERAMNAFYFLARYGARLFRMIREEQDLETRAHGVLFL
ncbi:MAG: bacillithiol biosynthesis cysteine-adding enzyme BshC [Blastocatellia bacterium]|nr:bacillithiol biosynthesis cysteine-adding enzyme BshC [Blastocatellia bacterium]MCS7158187.1 bacillithiol biosynthesis cysteine-adding enzyme BshC [Blastocatellia bacterium]MCX7752951.1 bacillithiol biosynthesis cysteine-adding enzyme BshC [Blastocatellia bacterium]MDW8168474.1 bacillithiol biosynthesis cysteine-adding enzyme BshC [Acidobacteriota bacterium]MDW8256888.1 bacillithiol biosynthesis cysteine-adding enzyme BshC [Acidobacteriota bacterium]